MKRKIYFVPACLVALVIFLTGATAQAPVQLFATQFYRALATTQQDRNFTFSPFSISQAFQLADLGARGETRSEIEQVIGTPQAAPSPLPSGVSVANRIWLQKGAPVHQSYLDESKARLDASPGLVDFIHHSDVATSTINRWVSEQTHGKIENLIPPGTLNSGSRLVLTNAVYFKAAWLHPFIKGDTFDNDFVLSSGRKARVPFMHEHKHLYYADEDRVRVLQLPYAGSQYAMLIVLPKEGIKLSEVEELLAPGPLDKWTEDLRSVDVRLALPRFRFDSSFVLNDELKKLGIRRAFAPAEADFSSINGSKGLFISQVLHKAYLDVNEDGTEAAAATAAVMVGMAFHEPEKPVEFTADHPFIFLIQDTDSEQILFMGRLSNPRS